MLWLFHPLSSFLYNWRSIIMSGICILIYPCPLIVFLSFLTTFNKLWFLVRVLYLYFLFFFVELFSSLLLNFLLQFQNLGYLCTNLDFKPSSYWEVYNPPTVVCEENFLPDLLLPLTFWHTSAAGGAQKGNVMWRCECSQQFMGQLSSRNVPVWSSLHTLELFLQFCDASANDDNLNDYLTIFIWWNSLLNQNYVNFCYWAK